jgi:hypothetical protein
VALVTGAAEVRAASDLFQTPPLVVPAPVPGGKPISLLGCAATDTTVSTAALNAPARRNIVKTTIDVLGRKVLVFGRFVPSTNIAAQMGFLDAPVVAAAMTTPAARGFGEDHLPRKRTASAAALSPPSTCAVR